MRTTFQKFVQDERWGCLLSMSRDQSSVGTPPPTPQATSQRLFTLRLNSILRCLHSRVWINNEAREWLAAIACGIIQPWELRWNICWPLLGENKRNVNMTVLKNVLKGEIRFDRPYKNRRKLCRLVCVLKVVFGKCYTLKNHTRYEVRSCLRDYDTRHILAHSSHSIRRKIAIIFLNSINQSIYSMVMGYV